ncbi:MAG: hypothetical protein QY309_02505 [Cyclobacteriaceae bacterium]|nr:MAG: hypothetical protein QY309_02505 [Cyclobacteriaceae bacterium]
MTFRNAVISVILLECLVAAFAFYLYGQSLEALQAVTRYSGRVSLLIFSIMFLLLPQHEITLERLLSPRPFLIFALAHGIHLVELITYVYLSGNELIPIRLAGGFLAYALIFAMPFIKGYAQMGKITVGRYKIAQTIYLYYVWFIFFMSYLPRVQGKLVNVGGQYWEFVVLLAWVCMMLGMKLSAILLVKRRI